MPAAHTKHPDGRPHARAAERCGRCGSRRATASCILEYGGLLAVLPGWSDMSRGMPGYCRDVIGQTPFGWSLDDAMEGLGPRAAQAEDFWRWRADKNAWAGFQQAVLGHLLGRLGPGARYWDVGGGKQPLVGRVRAPARPGSGPTRSCPRSA